jgi:hypothetical protein
MATKIFFTPKESAVGQNETSPVIKNKSFFEKASDFIGGKNLAKGVGIALSRYTPEVRELEKKVSSGTANDYELEAYQNIIGEAPTNKQIIGSALSLAANFIPGVSKGANMATKIAAGAGTGYAMDVGRGLQEKEGTKAFIPNVGTAVGASLPVIGAIIGKAASKMKPEALEQISLRLTPTETKNLAKQGKNIAKYISDKKIIGSPEQRYTRIDQLYDAMEDKIQEVIKISNKSYKKADIISKIKNIPKQFINDPAAYDSVVNETDRIIKNIQSKQGNEISAEIINEIKRNTYKRAYGKNATDIINDSYKAVGDSLKGVLDESITSLEKLNNEYGLIIASKTALQNAIGRPQVGMLGKIIGYTTGVAAGNTLMPGPLGMGAGALMGTKISDVLAGTSARSYSGAAIKTAQGLIKKIPTDKAGNLKITQKALINLLESLR